MRWYLNKKVGELWLHYICMWLYLKIFSCKNKSMLQKKASFCHWHYNEKIKYIYKYIKKISPLFMFCFVKRKYTWRCPTLSTVLPWNSLLFMGPQDFHWWSWTTFRSIWNPPDQNVILYFCVKAGQPGITALLFNQLQQYRWDSSVYTQVAWFKHNFPASMIFVTVPRAYFHF